MLDLCHLDAAPEVDTDKDSALVSLATSNTLQGETHTWWAITDPEDSQPTPVASPSWFQLPIDEVILTWKREHDV